MKKGVAKTTDEIADVWLIADKPEEKHQHTLVKEELERMDIKSELIDYADIKFPIDFDKSPKIARFIIDKKDRLPFQFAIFDNLKRNGTVILNEFEPMLMANKATSYAIWKNAHETDPNLGFLMPKTILTKDAEKARQFIDENENVLFKPIYSGAGWGIEMLNKDDPDLEEKLQDICCRGREIEGKDGTVSKIPPLHYFHLQKFVPNKNFDIRSIVIGNRHIAKYARYNEDVLHNIAQGGMGCKIQQNGDLKCKNAETDEFITFQDKLTRSQVRKIKSITNKVKELSGLDMVGVDIMPDQEGNMHVLEWNPSFQFTMGEKITRADIPKHIAKYIKFRMKEAKRTRRRRSVTRGEDEIPKRVLVFNNSGRTPPNTLNEGMDVFRDRDIEVEFISPTENLSSVDARDYAGIVVSGGGSSQVGIEVSDFAPEEVEILEQAIGLKMPVLGICLGHQILNKGFEGDITEVIPYCRRRTYTSKYPVWSMEKQQDECYKGIHLLGDGELTVKQEHMRKVSELGKNMTQIATSYCTEVEATCRSDAPVWGVQWHPEKEITTRSYNKHSPVMERFADLVSEYAENGDITGEILEKEPIEVEQPPPKEVS